MSEAIRLSKHLIGLIKCSRSEAEKYIEGGWVLVDGEIVDAPQFMIQNQKVELHANASLAPTPPATILLHMPDKFDESTPLAALKLITPETRAVNDNSGIRTLKRHFARLVPTAPLEPGATGLMVFTQDGRVVRRLVKDASKNEQEYVVEVSGEMADGGIERLKQGIKIGNWALPGGKVSWQNETRLRFALKNVRPGQIELMCKDVGLTVISMMRLRIGRVPMAKLPPGKWRYLPTQTLF